VFYLTPGLFRCLLHRPSHIYIYDSITGGNEGVGKRTSMTDGSGSASWVYNILGQLTKETKTITGSGTFLTEWNYDAPSTSSGHASAACCG
jgi:hypothetical protein